ncbi:MAG: xanthine dehydrogenase family protein molybdopterin-binding subunit [Dehalococcoidia bacterium]|nr:xanthine dehydrogenase family protein molybdopterin-binding subunit [Dehalococcoidia bacterium]|tara:strand:- start:100 stop:2388 length:2289 start_codon:yes stop_codon:yes gene_type:complete
MQYGSSKYKVIGTRPLRHDGVDKVTGRAIYGADVTMPRMIFGKILRSPHAHAWIKSIDVSKALAHPGVLAVVTAKDFFSREGINEEGSSFGENGVTLWETSKKYLSDNIMASDKVLYKGQPVAGVAATTVHIAEEALALIEVEYELIESVINVIEAMNENAARLHPNIRTDSYMDSEVSQNNVAHHIRHSIGDISKGFEESKIVIEREFDTATVHQAYIEPHNTTAFWNKDGRLTIWLSTQGPFEVRDMCAEVLGMDVSNVNVIPTEIGGGFGGKFEPYSDPVAALLSKKTGCPVKIVMTRQEDFESTGPTSGSHIRVKMGADGSGKIIAAQAYLAYEAGGYPGAPVDEAAMCIFSAYNIPNVLIDGLDVLVNKPKSAAYRAPGATNAAFACETVIEEIADELGLDSVYLRLINSAKEGTRRPDGPVYPRIGCVEVLEALKMTDHFNTPIEGSNRGRGIALGYWMNDGGASACTIKVNSDGTVNLNEGSPDIGGTRTSIAMQAAEVLGISAEDVKPSILDTDSIGYTTGTGGSSVTFKTGKAAHEAALDVLTQMSQRLATIWDMDVSDIDFEQGIFKSLGDPSLQMSFAELSSKLDNLEGPVVGSATVNELRAGGSFAACIADVEVDKETGKVDILKFTVVQDVGKAIHPSYVEGQMQGGSVQGIGWALNEEYDMSIEGHMLNSSLLDYRLPTSLDLPMIETVIVEVPNPTHPFGVRGVGEVSIVPPPAAIASAIYNATGVRLYSLPMKPGYILEKLEEKYD